MINKRKFIRLFILLIIIIFSLSVLRAILSLINFNSIFIATFLVMIFSNKKAWLILKKLLKKAKYLLKKNYYIYNTPTSRNEAALQSLKSIDQITMLIQDKIEAESIRQESKRVQRELLRGDLVVVFFGSGSSGKTSLVRALLNKIVGNVAPRMGSTKETQTYRLQLKNLKRGIKIIDTPGILEGGIEGRNREKEALIKATTADLIVFVVDNDLREYEMRLISHLSNVGKKLFIALNKCDLLGEREEERLLTILRRHCIDLVEPDNVIATVASPQTIPIVGSRPIQPRPEINQFIKRLAIVLHQEGEELIADNILLQCQNLGESGKKLLNRQRLIESQRCVEKYLWISSGVVLLTPLPGVDLLGAAVVNGRMVMDISRIFGVELTKKRGSDLAKSVGQTIAGMGIVKGGVSIISNSLSLHLPTYLIGKSIQGITAAWLTKLAGESFITYFQQDQEWGDGGIQEVVQRHYNLNSRGNKLKSFLNTAVNRVVDPVKKSKTKQLPPNLTPQGEEEP